MCIRDRSVCFLAANAAAPTPAARIAAFERPECFFAMIKSSIFDFQYKFVSKRMPEFSGNNEKFFPLFVL